jgi:hypothetical protein
MEGCNQNTSHEIGFNDDINLDPHPNFSEWLYAGYVYIMHPREFFKYKEPTYKVGETKDINERRKKGYPKGSKLLSCIFVKDRLSAEAEIKTLCREHPEIIYRKHDLGSNETFTGDINIIKNIMTNVCEEQLLNLVTQDISCEENKKIEQFVEKFNQYYEITNNDNDFILTTSLAKWAKDQKLKINSSKAINPVIEKILKFPKENRKQKKVEVGGSPIKTPKPVWIGIKKIKE